jgi:hypothetical protein
MSYIKYTILEEAVHVSYPIPACPVCNKSDKVIPIAYGLPSLEMFEESELGKIFLGGCLITEDMPLHHCKRDGWSF